MKWLKTKLKKIAIKILQDDIMILKSEILMPDRFEMMYKYPDISTRARKTSKLITAIADDIARNRIGVFNDRYSDQHKGVVTTYEICILKKSL